jgi:alkanesulfonate monooxygenase SsuD/methylene tetrahydromethanopterin reductase-like flavin-dependent oxidoreductase (luciferase family)
MMPRHPTEKTRIQAYDEDLDLPVRAVELGPSEAWIGEHFTTCGEDSFIPDLFIAKPLPVTQQMKLGADVALLPFQDPLILYPLILALRIAFLDHLAHGQFDFGFGADGAPTDMEMSPVEAEEGERRARTREATESVLKAWAETARYLCGA